MAFSQEMAGAEDDDAWMASGADELAQELAAREAERGVPGVQGAVPSGPGTQEAPPAFDPEQMAERVKARAPLACGCSLALVS